MSPDLVDFINGFLMYDPSQRMTAQQAMGHPWLTEGPCLNSVLLARNMLRGRNNEYTSTMNANLLMNIEQHIKTSMQVKLDLIKVIITNKPGNMAAVEATIKIMIDRYNTKVADCLDNNDIEKVAMVAKCIEVCLSILYLLSL
jgi:hypothetical protein